MKPIDYKVFRWFNSQKSTSIVAQRLLKSSCIGYLYIEYSESLFMAENCHKLQTMSRYILLHLVESIKDWKSFEYSRSILDDIGSNLRQLSIIKSQKYSRIKQQYYLP